MITYELLRHDQVTEPAVADINQLLAQLSVRRPKVDRITIAFITTFSSLFVGRDEDRRIVAMATLCIRHAPSGSTGHLEDIVVDASLRGQGVGEGIVRHAIDYAKNQRRIGRIELTSKAERLAANGLYQKLGFELRRETNYYRIDL